MFSFTSNAESVLLHILGNVRDAEDGLRENLSEAAHDALALIAHRVQQDGKGQNGQTLATKSGNRIGRYSKYHAKRRAARGRRTDMVDLTNEGTMFNDWRVLSTEPRQATGGFATPESADKAEHHEAYYGDIFGMNSEEQSVVLDGIEERLHVKLKQ